MLVSGNAVAAVDDTATATADAGSPLARERKVEPTCGQFVASRRLAPPLDGQPGDTVVAVDGHVELCRAK
jgi:hypothetical protein